MADVPHFSRATGDSLMTPGAPLWRPYRKRPLLLHDPKGGGTGSAERGPGVAGAVFRTTLVVQESSFRRLDSSTISPSRRGRRGGEVQAETVCSRRRRAPAATPSPCRSSLVTRRDCTDRVLRAGRSARARRGGEQFELGSVGVAKDEAGATLACDSDGRGVEHAALRLPDRDALLLGTQEGSTKSARSP